MKSGRHWRFRILMEDQCVLCNTIKGKGLYCAENKAEWHHKTPSAEQIEQMKRDMSMYKRSLIWWQEKHVEKLSPKEYWKRRKKTEILWLYAQIPEVQRLLKLSWRVAGTICGTGNCRAKCRNDGGRNGFGREKAYVVGPASFYSMRAPNRWRWMWHIPITMSK